MKLHTRNLIAIILGSLMIYIGVHHFRNPRIYDNIVPSYLGYPRFWTLFSGIIEVVLGLGLIIYKWRSLSAKLLIFFYMIVYLANINMWLNDIPFNGTQLNQFTHVIRLVIQILLILVCIWISRCNFSMGKTNKHL